MPDSYVAATSRAAYYPAGSASLARLWSREKLIQDLADLGVVDYFEGAGSNPTGLSGYDRAKLWLNATAGVTTSVGVVRKYAGGDPALLASWPALTRAGFVAHVRVGDMHFTWSAGTSGDPGPGKLLANNAALASATALHVSKTDVNGQDVASRIATWDDGARGDVFLTAVGSTGRYGLFRVTGALTDNTSYVTVPVAVQYVGSTAPAAGDFMMADFAPAANTSAAGSSGQMQMNVSGLLAATPGLEYDSANQRRQIVRGAGAYEEIPASQTSTAAVAYRAGHQNVAFTNGPVGETNYVDPVKWDGWNLSSPGVLIDATKAASWVSHEYRFFQSGTFLHEYHLVHMAPGSGLTINTTASGGKLTAAAVAAGGTNFEAGTRLTVPGGVNGVVQVSSVSAGGVVTGLTIADAGDSGYSSASGVAVAPAEIRWFSAVRPTNGGAGSGLVTRAESWSVTNDMGRQALTLNLSDPLNFTMGMNFGLVLLYDLNNRPVAKQKNSSGSFVDLPYLDNLNRIQVGGGIYSTAPAADTEYGAAHIFNATALAANAALIYGQQSSATTGTVYAINLANMNATANVRAAVGNNSTAGGTLLTLDCNGSLAGDPVIGFNTNDALAWSIGVDNSDSDRFKISAGGNRVGGGGGSEDRIVIDGQKNIGFNGGSFGGATGAMYIANATATPSSNPSGGGVIYVESGALKYRGSGGTVTTLGPA